MNMAIEILQKTNDGRELYQTPEQIERYGRNGDGWQLSFLQSAINGHLNERGKKLLAVLHRQVLLKDYQYPFNEFVAKFEAE